MLLLALADQVVMLLLAGRHELVVALLGRAEELFALRVGLPDDLLMVGLRLAQQAVALVLAVLDVLVVQTLGEGEDARGVAGTRLCAVVARGRQGGRVVLLLVLRRAQFVLEFTDTLARRLELGLSRGHLTTSGLRSFLRRVALARQIADLLVQGVGTGRVALDGLLRRGRRLTGLGEFGLETLDLSLVRVGRALPPGNRRERRDGCSTARSGLPGHRGVGLGPALPATAVVELVAQGVVLSVQSAQLDDNLVEKVVDLNLVVTAAPEALGFRELLLHDVFWRQRHVFTSVTLEPRAHPVATDHARHGSRAIDNTPTLTLGDSRPLAQPGPG